MTRQRDQAAAEWVSVAGTVLGVIGIDLPLKFVSELLHSGVPTKDSDFVTVEKYGEVVGSSEFELSFHVSSGGLYSGQFK